MSRDTRRKQIIRYWQRSIESKSFNGSPAGDGERRERGGGDRLDFIAPVVDRSNDR